MAALTHRQARRLYDRIGARQDTQRFYEDRATALILRHGRFDEARAVFEFGCGTGRFAAQMLERMPAESRYRAVDLSPEMVRLSRVRLTRWETQARVSLTDGDPPAGEPAAGYDRFVSTYVLDLLDHDEIRAVLREAHRMLLPSGLLCLTGLSGGCTRSSRIVAGVVDWIHAVRPSLAGGCRPVELLPMLPEARWQHRFHARVSAFGIPSEVVVARPRHQRDRD